jgi:hypothetical protein
VQALGTYRQTSFQQTFLAIAAANANKMYFSDNMRLSFQVKKYKTTKFQWREQTQS